MAGTESVSGIATRRRLTAFLVALAVAACAGPIAARPPVGVANGTPSASATIEGSASAAPSPAASATASSPSPPVALLPPATAPAAPTASPGGEFTIDLYRRGIYAMQATWWWCTAAAIEMLRNISLHQADHSAADQARYFDYSHAHDSYVMPADEGVDLVGLQAGLRHFVTAAYTLTASTTYDAAVSNAVLRLRLTRRPVVLVVDAGRHVWLMTGFTATSDPASGSSFRVLTVRIVGPLYGRQSVNGYDPPPDTRLSYDALRRFLLPYHFKFGPTPWDHRIVAYTA